MTTTKAKIGYSFDLSSIQPHSRDSHTVSGKIGGQDVTVSRYLDEWRPKIRVVIDGYTVHDCEATEKERNEFQKLQTRAFQAEMNASDEIRARVAKSEAFTKIFKS